MPSHADFDHALIRQHESRDRVDHSLKQPNVFAAAQPWAEEQVLHVACAYTNNRRGDARRRHMNDFRRHMAAGPNVALYVGEVAYGDRPFEVTSASHPRDLQLRTRDEMWHKENVLNQVIAARFPADWEYGAYCDGDFHMTRPDWALEAIHMLQHYDWVQLFSTYSNLSHDHKPLNVIDSFANQFITNGTSQINNQRGAYGPYTYHAGAPGGAWAFRRAAFNVVGGLLDICILGAADHYMAVGLSNTRCTRPESVDTDPMYLKAIEAWQERAYTLKGNIGCVNNHAMHYWHGPKANRQYGTRWRILRDNHFDPYVDIFRDHQGIYQLTPNKPALRDDIRRYFLARNEDDISLKRERPITAARGG